MPSNDFERFYESCFGDTVPVVRDGVNQKAIMNLEGNERREAKRLLLQSLGTDKDTYSRPVIALGLLCCKEAAEPLKERLNNAAGTDRIETALALFRIEKYPEAENIIINCLRVTNTNNPYDPTRLLAVAVLPFLERTHQVVQALLEAMTEDNIIGYSATGSLRKLFIEDEAVRNLLGEILLVIHDVHKPGFVGRPKLVKQAIELINARLVS